MGIFYLRDSLSNYMKKTYHKIIHVKKEVTMVRQSNLVLKSYYIQPTTLS